MEATDSFARAGKMGVGLAFLGARVGARWAIYRRRGREGELGVCCLGEGRIAMAGARRRTSAACCAEGRWGRMSCGGEAMAERICCDTGGAQAVWVGARCVAGQVVSAGVWAPSWAGSREEER